MLNLATLKNALAKKAERMEQLNSSVVGEKGEIRKFTEAEAAEYSKLEGEVKEVREAIKRAEEVAETRKTIAALDAPTREQPRLEVVREDKHNEDGEFRGYPEAKKGGYGQFLQDVHRSSTGQGTSETLRQLRAATGANEGVGADGGYLVQSDHAEMLFDAAKDSGKLASRCTTIPVSSNSTTITMLDESSLAVGSQFGGIRAYWRAEAGQVTATRPKFRQENIKVEALEALFYATEEQLEDAPQLATFANMAFEKAIGFQIDDAIISGNGAGKPLGIINSPAALSVAKEGGQTADTVKYENVDKMVDRLLVGSEGKAVWLIHPDVRQQLRNAMWKPGTLTEYPVYLPQGGIAGNQNGTLFGYPVERVQQCPKLGDLGDIMLLDLSWYALFRKSGLKASQSVHVAFLTSEQVFKWTVRLNGMPLLNTPITDAYGTTTRSPFVLLAERA